MPEHLPVDVGAARRVIGEAFANDPLLRWVFPDDDSRAELTAAWLGIFIEGYARDGIVDVLEDEGEVVAVAAWRVPGDAPIRLPELPSLGGLLAALVGRDRAVELGSALGAFASVRPEHPFAYLHFLAVHPSHQGRGWGRRVIGSGLAAAAGAGLGVHLESTNPANLSFYESLGFEVTREFRLEPNGPKAWAMWLEPPQE